MNQRDLQKLRLFLVEVAQEAGLLINTAQPSASTIDEKKNTTDIVTETDRKAEALIRKRLQDQYPQFSFVGEESFDSKSGVSDEPTFIVDPIDGTSNFVHGFPEVCVSIGFVIKKQPTVGVVYNPFRNELWAATRGQGAFFCGVNGKQTLPFTRSSLEFEKACIGLEWGSDREGPNFDLNLHVFTTLARTKRTGGRFVNSLRFTGSAALAICRVAAGQQDAFWECGSWAWDVAASWCILTEAGGIMVDGHPGEWSPPIDGRRYLAVRPALEGQKEFVEQFWSVIGDKRSAYGKVLD
ncbi:hypothetical protein N7495_003508 [Penicillium taxi]|uniref:uncharacterized protein n=1 Tax=Penicillium taxi TaxID=168475 RepID=UPI0025454453|nr:uncharacterized protein N7495_003508 [Penicillium taxi]KAJ5898764.1 hypothetical protein N7495_003508 [Penicillium taxi]